MSLHVSLSNDVLCEQLNDEVVLLDMRSGLYFGLTPVASEFWLALNHGKTVAEAEAELLDQFDVPSDQLESDLAVLIAKLEAKNLVTVARLADAA